MKNLHGNKFICVIPKFDNCEYQRNYYELMSICSKQKYVFKDRNILLMYIILVLVNLKFLSRKYWKCTL